MGGWHVCRGSGNSCGDGTNDDLKPNRAVDHQALLTGWTGYKKNAHGHLLEKFYVPRFLYLFRSISAASRVGWILSWTVFPG
jgi:hypothetical protein